jgi:putative ATP-dependent endonuclease of the OLD family
MRISRIQIDNFRNFKHLDVNLNEHAVIVGENKIGKSNLLYALRLVLDPGLPDSARQLRDEDFWDGIARPLAPDAKIVISIDISDYEANTDLLADLADHVLTTGPLVAQLTYEFGRIAPTSPEAKDSKFEFNVYGGGRPDNHIGWELRRAIPIDLLHALRDAEGDLESWRRSPLRPLLDEVVETMNTAELEKLSTDITEATDALKNSKEIGDLAGRITERLKMMVGESHSLDTTLGFTPSDPERLLRALRLFIDGGKRTIGDASLGSANLLYITLKALQLEHLVQEGDQHHTFLAIEEPEAHLHPHLQRLVYRDFLRTRDHANPDTDPAARPAAMTILLTTHSPHIASVSPINSFLQLRKSADKQSTVGVSTANLPLDKKDCLDLERYLDVTRGEALFAKGIILVEGDAELYLLPRFANLQGLDLDALGITVCSVSGTNFAPYVKLFGPAGLDIPFALLTDFDPTTAGSLGETRVTKLLTLLGKPPSASNGATLKVKAASHGIFLNDHTLEVDLFNGGRAVEICDSLIELAISDPAKTRAEAWRNDPSSLDIPKFLGDISHIGKGRFAQRLATNLKSGPCPDYITNAITYVSTLCS